MGKKDVPLIDLAMVNVHHLTLSAMSVTTSRLLRSYTLLSTNHVLIISITVKAVKLFLIALIAAINFLIKH